MPWKTFLKNYFGFSRAERFGVLGLCGCILLVVGLRLLLPHWIKHQPPDTTAYQEEIARFRQDVDSVYLAKNQPTQPDHSQPSASYFYFDPNRATDADWEKLGLNSRQIRNIRNYQAKGGQFRQKTDLQKLYTIPATLYQQLEPYIRIAGNETPVKKQPAEATHAGIDTKATKSNATSTPPTKTLLHIELNTADSSLLTQLSGIGPVLASRIVKYRNRIGGYAEVSQLGEVYGIKPELVDRLAPQLSADTSLVRKIPANTATFKDLVSHPYLNEQQTKGILNYRKLQGRINNLDELVRNHILMREDADKMAPYITFD